MITIIFTGTYSMQKIILYFTGILTVKFSGLNEGQEFTSLIIKD